MTNMMVPMMKMMKMMRWCDNSDDDGGQVMVVGMVIVGVMVVSLILGSLPV